jgi:hypothetical protein
MHVSTLPCITTCYNNIGTDQIKHNYNSKKLVIKLTTKKFIITQGFQLSFSFKILIHIHIHVHV